MMNGSTASENDRKRKREAGHDVNEKFLYFCFCEDSETNKRYSVRAIKVSDLFVFSDTSTAIYPSSSDDCDVPVREVASLGRDDGLVLPYGMGFGVYASRIVLIGGFFFYSQVPGICYDLDTTDPNPNFQESSVIPHNSAPLHCPFLEEIDGKLYALSTGHFHVFDPNQSSETKSWTPLPCLSFDDRPYSFAVVGRKILTSISGHITLCYDLDEGTWTDIEPLWCYPGKTVVVDWKGDYFDKVMFVCREGIIDVFGIRLSAEGVPTDIEYLAFIQLPQLPSLSNAVLTSFSCAYLGDGKVCFALLYLKGYNCQLLRVFTFEFAHNDEAVAGPPSISSRITNDTNFLPYNSSFHATALGCRLFEFKYDDNRPADLILSNCLVL